MHQPPSQKRETDNGAPADVDSAAARRGDDPYASAEPDRYRLRTIAEVAQRAGCHRKTVERAIKAGRLAALNIGKPGARRPEIRIRPEDEEAWLENCLVQPRQAAPACADEIRGVGARLTGRGRLQVAEGMGRD